MLVIAPSGMQNTAVNELLALFELMYLVATADGFFSPEERGEFLQIAESLSEGKMGSHQISTLVQSWEKRSAGISLDARLKQLAAALPDEISRRIAYGCGSIETWLNRLILMNNSTLQLR